MKNNLIIFNLLFIGLFFLSCNDKNLSEIEPDTNKDQVKIDIDNIYAKYQKAISSFKPTKKVEYNMQTTEILSCYNPQGCSKTTDTATIDMPGYGDCKAQVIWNQYWCAVTYPGGGHIVTVVFDSVSVTPLVQSGYCDSVVSSWNDLYLNNNLSQLEQDIYDFESVADSIIRDSVMRSIVLKSRPFSNCDSPNFFLNSKFYKADCYTTCFKITVIGGVLQPYVRKNYCGEVCCIEENGWCWNVLGDSIQKTNTVKIPIGICEYQELGTNCEKGFFGLSKYCIDHCNQ